MLHLSNEREGGESPQLINMDAFILLREAAIKASVSAQGIGLAWAECQPRIAAEGDDQRAEEQNANQGN
jgi:hypothetical protein